MRRRVSLHGRIFLCALRRRSLERQPRGLLAILEESGGLRLSRSGGIVSRRRIELEGISRSIQSTKRKGRAAWTAVSLNLVPYDTPGGV